MSPTTMHRADCQAALLEEWVQTRRRIAQLEAQSAALLADRLELMDEDVAELPMQRDAIWRSMVAEFSAAGRIARGSVEGAFTVAHALADFPAVQESFSAGAVSAAHVREILKASGVVVQAVTEGTVEAGVLRLYEAGALEFAEHEAPARTRAHVRGLASALAGSTVTERHENAREEREVTVRTIGDGLALLQAVLPEHLAIAILDRLTQLARHQQQHPDERVPTLPVDLAEERRREQTIFGSDDTFTRDPFDGDDDAYWAHVEQMIATGPQVIRVPADSRTLDQIRADLLSDLLLSAAPSEVQGAGLENIRGTVQVTVAATTLAGLDDLPAQLDGHGVLHPGAARTLAAQASSWTRLFLDGTGLVTHTDTYMPTAGMRRHLTARDQHCRFPGCRMPIHRCELDHTHDHAKGGNTSLDNLAHLCRTHHALKHPDVPESHRWTARQLPDWTLEWTSPTGRTHTDHPPRRVMFVPTPPLRLDEHVGQVPSALDSDVPF